MTNKNILKSTRALITIDNKKNRLPTRSQVTIWVIIGIIIILMILLFFVLQKKKIIPYITPTISEPREYIDKCTKDAVEEAVNIMLSQGGYLSPYLYKLYEDKKVAYLCYSKRYYEPCINQEPFYTQHIESEIKKYVEPEIENCFSELREQYEKREWQVDMSGKGIKVELAPKQIKIDINKNIKLARGENLEYKNFQVKILSPLYDMVSIAREIVNGEAKNCEYDYLSYRNKYPKYNIKRIFTEDNTKIYTIEGSNKKLVFATRSCALPGAFIYKFSY